MRAFYGEHGYLWPAGERRQTLSAGRFLELTDANVVHRNHVKRLTGDGEVVFPLVC